jgi:hypothetical protein
VAFQTLSEVAGAQPFDQLEINIGRVHLGGVLFGFLFPSGVQASSPAQQAGSFEGAKSPCKVAIVDKSSAGSF